MNNEVLDKNEQENNTTQYAGFGIRLTTYLIDFAIFTVIAYFIWGSEVVNTTNGIHINYTNEKVLIPMGYMLLSWLLLSSTPGKLILGVKIVDEKGDKIKFDRVFLRLLGYILLPIGCWFILGNDKNQALHDKIANTFCCKEIT